MFLAPTFFAAGTLRCATEDRDIPNRTIEDHMDVPSRMRGDQVHVAPLRLGASSRMKRSTRRWSGLKKSARW